MSIPKAVMQLINEGTRLCCLVDDLQHRMAECAGIDKLRVQADLRRAILRRDDIAASIAELGGIKGYEEFHDKEFMEVSGMISEVFLKLVKEEY